MGNDIAKQIDQNKKDGVFPIPGTTQWGRRGATGRHETRQQAVDTAEQIKQVETLALAKIK